MFERIKERRLDGVAKVADEQAEIRRQAEERIQTRVMELAELSAEDLLNLAWRTIAEAEEDARDLGNGGWGRGVREAGYERASHIGTLAIAKQLISEPEDKSK